MWRGRPAHGEKGWGGGGGGGGSSPLGGKPAYGNKKPAHGGGGGGTAHEGKKLAYGGEKPAHRGKELAHGRKGGGGGGGQPIHGKDQIQSCDCTGKASASVSRKGNIFLLPVHISWVNQATVALTGQLAAKYTAVLLFPSS